MVPFPKKGYAILVMKNKNEVYFRELTQVKIGKAQTLIFLVGLPSAQMLICTRGAYISARGSPLGYMHISYQVLIWVIWVSYANMHYMISPRGA